MTRLEKDFHGLPVLCLADLSNNKIEYISPELVAKTRCSKHGVVSKLEIVLKGNKVHQYNIIFIFANFFFIFFLLQKIQFYAKNIFPNLLML